MELKAIIYKVGETQQVTEKFKKRELIVITESTSQYPQHIKVQLSQDKCSLADTLVSGQEVTFHINLRGKLYTDKNGAENSITNLDVWKLDAGSVGSSTNQPYAPAASGADDLPF